MTLKKNKIWATFEMCECMSLWNGKYYETKCAGLELGKAASVVPAGSSTSKLSDTLQKAAEAVNYKEGKFLVAQCQKHIKLADRSEHGWKVVQEYELDVLADNSDDEKRITKTGKAAETKAESASKKRPQRVWFAIDIKGQQ